MTSETNSANSLKAMQARLADLQKLDLSPEAAVGAWTCASGSQV